MSFVEVRFPTGISYGSVGGPNFNTDVVELGSGIRHRNAFWSLAEHRYDVAHGVRSRTDVITIRDFFYARMGKAIGFRYKDWGDYEGSGEPIGTGDASEDEFQLIKRYTSGGVNYDRTIKKPVASSETIYLAGVPQGSGYTLDTTTGIVTFSSPPGMGVAVTADFEFDVPVHFDQDNFPSELMTASLDNLPPIVLVEDKAA